MQQQYPNAEIITDVASGLNYRRKGLATILERLHRGDKLTLVVAYRDRLARFGTELMRANARAKRWRTPGSQPARSQPPRGTHPGSTRHPYCLLCQSQRTPQIPEGNPGSIRIYPDRQQKATLKLWFDAARFTYNHTIELLNAGRSPKGLLARGSRRISSPDYPTGPSDVPYEVKSNAVRDACLAVSAVKKFNKQLKANGPAVHRRADDLQRPTSAPG